MTWFGGVYWEYCPKNRFAFALNRNNVFSTWSLTTLDWKSLFVRFGSHQLILLVNSRLTQWEFS